MEEILEKGFSALARTENDETPVHLALELTVKFKNRILKFNRKLSESEDEISESKEKLDSILDLDERMSKLLIKSCDISKLRDEIYQLQRWTLLYLAAAANSVYIVKYILPGNSDWRGPSKGPQYLLIHITARTGNLDLLRFFIEREKGR